MLGNELEKHEQEQNPLKSLKQLAGQRPILTLQYLPTPNLKNKEK